jgi:hypothetical protein
MLFGVDPGVGARLETAAESGRQASVVSAAQQAQAL